jgi:glycosyltransferase involved in cell wall biosynthesis
MIKNPRLKVAFYDPSGRGGICHYTFQLAQGLVDNGCEVTLLAPHGYELQDLPRNFRLVILFKKSWLKNWLLKLAKAFSRRTPSSPIIVQHGASPHKPWRVAVSLRKARLGLIFFKALVYLLWWRPHVIHIQWLAGGEADLDFFRLLKWCGFPIIYTAHDLLPHDADTDQNRRLFQQVYALADCLIVHGENIRQEMIDLFQIDPGKISVVPHGSNILFSNESKAVARRRLEIPLNGKVVLFFGLIKPYKGLEYLLQAFNTIKDRIPGPLLVIAGRIADEDQAMYERYRSMLSQFAEENPVRCVTEYIPVEQVGAFFSAADVIVLPHVKPSQSGVLLTAIAAGKPVVVTDAGGLSEVVENGRSGFVVPPRDATAIAEALIKILQNPAVMERMGREAQTLAENHYSWRAVAAQTLTLYRSLSVPLAGDLGASEVVLPN